MGNMNGADVSAFQSPAVTTQVPLDFGFVKATQGTDYVSSACDQQVQGLLNAGKGMGFYHFTDGADANAEADHFVSQTKGYHGKGIPIIDFEGGGIARGGGWLLQLANRVAAGIGVKPIIYMSLSVAERSDMKQVADADYGLWVAYGSEYDDRHDGYVNVPAASESGQWPFAIARQYTSNGWLNGIGKLDLDVFYGDRTVFDAYAGGKPNPNPPKPAPPSTAIPAYPLPSGYYIGPERGPVKSVSGWHGNADAVRQFQQRLKDRGWDIQVDSKYGHVGDTAWDQSETGRIIHAYQEQKGLVTDGLGGINTWVSLWRDPIT